MTRRIAIGIDQGGMTGIAAYGDNGFEYAHQDEERPALLDLFVTLQSYRRAGVEIVGVAVEAPYVGANARSSISVAESGGRAMAMLWVCGIDEKPWRPGATEWRKALGFQLREEGIENGKRFNRPRKRDQLEADARKMAEGISGTKYNKAHTHEAEALLIAKATWMRWHSRREMAGREMAAGPRER